MHRPARRRWLVGAVFGHLGDNQLGDTFWTTWQRILANWRHICQWLTIWFVPRCWSVIASYEQPLHFIFLIDWGMEASRLANALFAADRPIYAYIDALLSHTISLLRIRLSRSMIFALMKMGILSITISAHLHLWIGRDDARTFLSEDNILWYSHLCKCEYRWSCLHLHKCG